MALESNWGEGEHQTDEPASELDGETHVLASLYDALDREPSSVYIHERLLEVWKELGDEGSDALLYSILSLSMSCG